VSMLKETSFTPSAEIALCVGFMANIPVYDAGRMTLPPFCVPRLNGT
jgi:hypothetical protein